MSAKTTETPGRSYLAGSLRWAKRLGTVAILALTLGYVGLIVLGYQPMTMITGSMQPTIPVGSLVVSHSVAPDTLEVGDVISFQKPIGAPGLDTHRIVSIKSEGRKRFYQTKGDSNTIVDPWVTTFDAGMEAHRVVFHVPYLGNALLFARSSVGRILLLGYVCFILLFSIFKGIALAAKKKEEEAAPPVDPAFPRVPESARGCRGCRDRNVRPRAGQRAPRGEHDQRQPQRAEDEPERRAEVGRDERAEEC